MYWHLTVQLDTDHNFRNEISFGFVVVDDAYWNRAEKTKSREL